MSRDILRVGIAGYGVVGKRRRQCIDLHPRLKTVAVCDQSLPGDGEFTDKVVFCKDYRRLLEKDLDVLFVCLPNYLAPDVTIAALEKGMHVFCEKPPGRNVKDIEQVISIEKKNPKLKLKYGFNHRYHDSVRDALRIVRSGELGKVINIRGVYGKSKIIPFSGGWRAERRYSGGGILLDQGIHMVDLMRLFSGDFNEVYSFISNDFWHHDVEDNAYALMKTQEGIIAMLHSSATSWRHRFYLDITLERGGITLSGILSGSKSYGAEKIKITFASEDDSGDPREQITSYNQDNSWRDEIHEFADAIINHKTIVNGSSEDALKTMQLIYRIYGADSSWVKSCHLSDQILSESEREKS